MAESDEEKLVIDIVAKLNNLEKQMAKANQITARAYRDMSRNSGRATKQMEDDAIRSSTRVNQAFATISTKVGDYGKAFAGGLWAGVAAGGIAGVAAAVRNVTASFAELNIEAKTAGVHVEDFQRWRYVAQQNRIGIDAMIDGFKELNLRADEYIQTGKGSAAESFQRLGMSPDEVKTRIKDPSAFMLELIERTRRLKDTAAGVRIFDELFGGSGGEQYVRLIEQGRQGITDTLNEADKVGEVFDKNFIERAEEIDKQFNRISTTVGTTLKSAIIQAYEALGQFLSIFQQFENRKSDHLRSQMNLLIRENEAAEKKLGGWFDTPARKTIEKNKPQIEKIQAELDRRDQANINVPPIKDEPPVAPYVPPEKPKKTGNKDSASKGNKERTDEYQRLTERIRENILALQAEAEAQGMLNPAINDYGYAVEKARMQQELMNAAKRAGKEITPELKKEIEGLAHQYADTRAEAEKMAEAQNKALDDLDYRKDIVRDALGGLRSALADGKISFEELGDIALSVLDKVIDKIQTELIDAIFSMNSAMGGGGGGGIFGSLLGGIFGGGGGGDPWAGMRVPGFANGTNSAPGGLSWVGERGPELMNLPRGAQIIPNHAVGQYLGNNGQGQASSQVARPASTPPASLPQEQRVRVEVELSGDLVGRIVEQSQKNTVELIQNNEQAKANQYQNGSSNW